MFSIILPSHIHTDGYNFSRLVYSEICNLWSIFSRLWVVVVFVMGLHFLCLPPILSLKCLGVCRIEIGHVNAPSEGCFLINIWYLIREIWTSMGFISFFCYYCLFRSYFFSFGKKQKSSYCDRYTAYLA